MANLRDILVFGILLFAVGLSVVMSVYISHSIANAVINTPTIGNNSYANQVMTNSNTAINMEDYIYLGMFIGLIMFIIISSWFVSDYPIFAPVYFFGLVVVVFIAYVLQGSWNAFASNSIIATTSSSMPITSFILGNLTYFVAAAGLIGLAIIYGKPKSEVNL